MNKNILNEELNQMKYLFGYKAGKVISEQNAAAQLNSKTKSDSQQTVSPQNNIELAKILTQAIVSGVAYVADPKFKNKIIVGPRYYPTTKYGIPYIGYTVFPMTKDLKVGKFYSIAIGPLDNEKLSQTPKDLLTQLQQRPQELAVESPRESPGQTKPIDFFELFGYVGAEKNPKPFMDFLKSLDPMSETWVKENLLRYANYPVEGSDEARKIYGMLFPEPTAQQQTQTKP